MPPTSPPHRASGRSLGGCLLLIGLFFAVVVGCSFFAFRHFTGVIEDEVATLLRENEVATHHLGEIREIDFDLEVTGKLAEGKKDGEEKPLGFRVVGSKASGNLVVWLPPSAEKSDAFAPQRATLTLDGGEAFELDLRKPEEGDAPTGAPDEATDRSAGQAPPTDAGGAGIDDALVDPPPGDTPPPKEGGEGR